MNSEWRLRVLLVLAASVLPGCYDGDSTAFHDAVIVGRERITAVTVTGEQPVIEVGSELALTATGTALAGPVDLTGKVTWISSNPAAVTVNSRGRVTGVGNGSAVITATLAQFSDSVTIAASDAALTGITVAGAASVDECAGADYTASGQYDDATSRDITPLVSWAVTDSTVARMSTLAADRNHLVSKLAGSTDVVASRNGIDSAPFAVTVEDNLTALNVTPDAPAQIKEGDTLNFTATGTWGATSAVISRAASWSVVNAEPGDVIGSIAGGDTNPGRFTALKGGAGTVTGSCGGLSDEVSVTVVFLQSLAITNTEPVTLARNASLLLVLRGTYSDASTKSLNESATWSLTMVSGSTLTVSNAVGSRGRVTAGTGAGVATVKAVVSGKETEVTVTVD